MLFPLNAGKLWLPFASSSGPYVAYDPHDAISDVCQIDSTNQDQGQTQRRGIIWLFLACFHAHLLLLQIVFANRSLVLLISYGRGH